MKKLGCLLITLAVMVTVSPSSEASLLIQTPGPLSTVGPEPDPSALGVVTQVMVGSSPVNVNQIGQFGQVTTATMLEYLIFPNAGGAPLLQTSAQSFGVDGSAVWHDSAIFRTFTLSANTTYWIGVGISGPFGAMNESFNFLGASPFSQNGLTIGTTNGQAQGTFASPIGVPNTGSIQPGTRLFFTPVTTPEPVTTGLIGAGLAFLMIKRRLVKTV